MLPFRLDTRAAFEAMRIASTPHTWSNAQQAWDDGRMGFWPAAKKNHSMAYYAEADLLSSTLARAFTICDAYHCSFTGGTNVNRLFLWTGTNDGADAAMAPPWATPTSSPAATLRAPTPDHLSGTAGTRRHPLAHLPGHGGQLRAQSHRRLQGLPRRLSRPARLAGGAARKGAEHARLDRLRQDALDGTLPQVSWICPTKAGSEHPSPSSPAQGADYVARVLDALTANPQVWSRTVLLLMFDENDGFFDHMPPPAPPRAMRAARWPAPRR